MTIGLRAPVARWTSGTAPGGLCPVPLREYPVSTLSVVEPDDHYAEHHYVEHVLADAPALTTEQRDQLATILRGGAR